jgi:RND family efflux transporter MFP subunit
LAVVLAAALGGGVRAGSGDMSVAAPILPGAAVLAPRGSDRLRGLVVPRQQATIAAALPATVTAIGPENGERFAKGQVLVAFDCRINEAELGRAEAMVEAARDTLVAKSELAATGSIARLQAVLAEAELKKARAEARVAETRVAFCTIPAPYAGRVVRRIANPHETVAARDPLIEIVDDSAFEVRAFVPSAWLGRVREGMRLSLVPDETGERIDLSVVAVGAAIDNVSQLIELRAAVVGTPARLVAGMSGDLEFALPEGGAP